MRNGYWQKEETATRETLVKNFCRICKGEVSKSEVNEKVSRIPFKEIAEVVEWRIISDKEELKQELTLLDWRELNSLKEGYVVKESGQIILGNARFGEKCNHYKLLDNGDSILLEESLKYPEFDSSKAQVVLIRVHEYQKWWDNDAKNYDCIYNRIVIFIPEK